MVVIHHTLGGWSGNVTTIRTTCGVAVNIYCFLTMEPDVLPRPRSPHRPTTKGEGPPFVPRTARIGRVRPFEAPASHLRTTPFDLVALQTAAADCVTRAIVRAVLAAESVDRSGDGGALLPSYREAVSRVS